jgi:hypothetical protein
MTYDVGVEGITGAFCLIAHKEPLFCVDVPGFPRQESQASARQRLFVFLNNSLD